MQNSQVSEKRIDRALVGYSSKIVRAIQEYSLDVKYLPSSVVDRDNTVSNIVDSSDPKTLRMFKIFADRSYESSWHNLRQQSILIYWSVRGMVLSRLKRLFDIVISLLTIIFTSPIWILTAIAVKLESPGPILFKQERVGKYGQLFMCLKFRSMYMDAEERKAELLGLNEADEIVFKIKEDPRITRVGRIIRKLSIDEIPQLLNVLRGDMSLVGPRPPVPIEVVQYNYDTFRRLEAVPGITGLQQVSGRSDLTFKRWVELDIQYIQERSLRKDIMILLKTIPTVISRRGAY